MYERVWSGELNYPDEAKWDLALDFDQETGLFRCSGSLNGGAIEAHECADPVIAGYMEKSDDKILPDGRQGVLEASERYVRGAIQMATERRRYAVGLPPRNNARK